jgi:hypothetical protein
VWALVPTSGFATGLECLDHTELANWPDWLRLLALPPPSGPLPPATPILVPNRLTQARIDGVLSTVADAPEGQRNAVLHLGACRMHELANDGAISRRTAVGLFLRGRGASKRDWMAVGRSIPPARRHDTRFDLTSLRRCAHSEVFWRGA